MTMYIVTQLKRKINSIVRKKMTIFSVENVQMVKHNEICRWQMKSVFDG